MDLKRTRDREILQMISLVINRTLLNAKKIRASGEKRSRSRIQLEEAILEDLRRLTTSIVIWKGKRRAFTEEDYGLALRSLLRAAWDVVLGG